MDEMSLTKGQVRKLNALKKSIGDDLGTEAFTKWMSNQEIEKSEGVKVDPVAVKLQEVLSHLESDPSGRLYWFSATTLRNPDGHETKRFFP